MHGKITFLAFLAYDWSQLHAGIACLASLAYDWVITNGCFNTFGVSSYYGIAYSLFMRKWCMQTCRQLTWIQQVVLFFFFRMFELQLHKKVI